MATRSIPRSLLPHAPVRIEIRARRRSRPAIGALLTLGTLLFGGLYVFMGLQEDGVRRRALVNEDLDATGRARTIVGAAEAIRALKVITVYLDTSVTVERQSESWRGDASATVTAPVRLSYGVDLSALPEGAISTSPIGNSIHVRVPGPARLATEVLGEASSEVTVGWARLRTRAGEYVLGLARRDMYDAALALRLSDSDAQRIRDMTREQLIQLIRTVTGTSTDVSITFIDPDKTGDE